MEKYSSIGKRVILSGGEITTRDDLYLIVKKAHDCGLDVDLISNGTLWTDELIDKVAPYVNRIQISVDGYDEETNARVRGSGNFNKALICVDKFIKAGVFTSIGMTPFYDDRLKDEHDKYASFIKNMRNKYSSDCFDIFFNSELLDGRDRFFSDKEKRDFFKTAEMVFRDCNGDVMDIPFVKVHRQNKVQKNCSYGNLAISCTGDVYFCALVELMKPVANIRNTSFEKIIELAEKAKISSCVDNILPCKNCELKYICGGDCRVKYFKSLADFNIDDIESGKIPTRICDQSRKEYYYDLMIRTNEQIFQ